MSAFVQPFINTYGYVCPQNSTCVAGQPTGGGVVGLGAFSADNDSFFRKSGQIGYNYTLGTNLTHDLHVGYQRYNDSEDRFQTSNGWGSISIPAGVGDPGTCPKPICGPTDTAAFFVAAFSPQTTAVVSSNRVSCDRDIRLRSFCQMCRMIVKIHGRISSAFVTTGFRFAANARL